MQQGRQDSSLAALPDRTTPEPFPGLQDHYDSDVDDGCSLEDVESWFYEDHAVGDNPGANAVWAADATAETTPYTYPQLGDYQEESPSQNAAPYSNDCMYFSSLPIIICIFVPNTCHLFIFLLLLVKVRMPPLPCTSGEASSFVITRPNSGENWIVSQKRDEVTMVDDDRAIFHIAVLSINKNNEMVGLFQPPPRFF